MATTDTTTPVHPFEAAKLGKAPFYCMGMVSIPSTSLLAQNPAAYNNAMASLPQGIGIGSCAYCGMCLTHNFIIKSACGRRFVVGCECVNRTADAGLIKEVKAERTRVAREKRETRRNTARAEREAAWKLEREARAAEFVKNNAALIARAEAFPNNPFITDVIKGGVSGRYVSDKALAAVTATIAAWEQRVVWKANSRHIGTIGKRETFNVLVDRIASFLRLNFATGRTEEVYIITMRDEAGNAIVSKSSSFYAERGAKLTIKATVKAHDRYDGEQQTIVQRIKVAA